MMDYTNLLGEINHGLGRTAGLELVRKLLIASKRSRTVGASLGDSGTKGALLDLEMVHERQNKESASAAHMYESGRIGCIRHVRVDSQLQQHREQRRRGSLFGH